MSLVEVLGYRHVHFYLAGYRCRRTAAVARAGGGARRDALDRAAAKYAKGAPDRRD